jgi:hypothetical protein
MGCAEAIPIPHTEVTLPTVTPRSSFVLKPLVQEYFISEEWAQAEAKELTTLLETVTPSQDNIAILEQAAFNIERIHQGITTQQLESRKWLVEEYVKLAIKTDANAMETKEALDTLDVKAYDLP